MSLPIRNLDNRSLSMRDQVIERLMEIKPGFYRRSYLETLKDHALVQALEVAVMCHMDAEYESQGSYMFNAGMDYERQRIVKSLTETRSMKAGELIATWSNK